MLRVKFIPHELDSKFESVNKKHEQILEVDLRFWNAYSLPVHMCIGHPDAPRLQAQLEKIYNEEKELLDAISEEMSAISQLSDSMTGDQSMSLTVCNYKYNTDSECIEKHYKLMEAEKKRRQNQNVLDFKGISYNLWK